MIHLVIRPVAVSLGEFAPGDLLKEPDSLPDIIGEVSG